LRRNREIDTLTKVDNIRGEIEDVALEQGQIKEEDYLDLPNDQVLDYSEDRGGPSEGTVEINRGKNDRENAKRGARLIITLIF
jgi:hypothetical protein